MQTMYRNDYGCLNFRDTSEGDISPAKIDLTGFAIMEATQNDKRSETTIPRALLAFKKIFDTILKNSLDLQMAPKRFNIVLQYVQGNIRSPFQLGES